ncbi:MAG: polysaccharide deacetylase family protein, partial [Anaerolineae bacterium]
RSAARATRIAVFAACILVILGLGGVLLACNAPSQGGQIPADSPFVGTYYLGSGVNDPFGPPVYQLVLGADGKAVFTTFPRDTDQPIVVTSGTWEMVGNQAIVTFAERDGTPIDEPIQVVFEYQDMFLVAVEQPFGDERYQFTLGSGDSHPAVRRVHELLAAIPWIEYQDPGPDATVYDDDTRKAIMEFQRSQGLVANGVVNGPTWQALHDPVPPAETQPTAAPPAEPPDTGDSVANRPTHIDGKPVLYLTFDDGPHGTYTRQILDVLAQYDARATFFVLGQQTSSASGVVGDTFARGSYAANHTYSHADLTTLGQAAFDDEINRTFTAIQDATDGQDQGRNKLLCLRPPYGASDSTTASYAAALGYELVLWDVDPQDWRQPGADQIAKHIINNARPGAIVLMHDGGGHRDQTVAALKTVLSTLSEQGYRFEALCR